MNGLKKTFAVAVFASAGIGANAMSFDSFFDDIRKFDEQANSFLKKAELAYKGTLKSVVLNEDKKVLEFEFNFAGFDISEITASISDDRVLKIIAEKKVQKDESEESEKGGKSYIYKLREAKQKSFRFDLKELDLKGFDIDLDKPIDSTYKNGILKINILLKKKVETELKLSIKSEEQEDK